MLEYLKAAFFASPVLPILGRVPLNALFVLAAVILGFVEYPIWLAALGLETAYLFMLATNPRFQRVVDASRLGDTTELQRRELIAQISSSLRARLDKVEQKCARVIDVSRRLNPDDLSPESQKAALDKLTWVYLKLLLARQFLESQDAQTAQHELTGQIRQLTGELEDPNLPRAARDSKAATLAILRKRVANIDKRQETLQSIDADLVRIEAQVDLTLENAVMKGEPQAPGASIDLASTMLDSDMFGSSADVIANLDSRYNNPRTPEAPPPTAVSPPPLTAPVPPPLPDSQPPANKIPQ